MNPYVDLCLSIQALRRDIERVRTPLATALGVAASVYTHQLANTLRVLTDVRVRHLLADEVGLGKTVQALMVVNAIKCQRRSLRVLVIVPDRLVPQWRDEILTRAHTAPVDGEIHEVESEGNQYIRLAWEDQLKKEKWSLSDIDSEKYDFIIVDELHKLTTSVQDRIVKTAPDFEHLLILTATPEFQKAKRHAELFAILEPERTAIARWQSSVSNTEHQGDWSDETESSQWSEATSKQIVQALLDRDNLASSQCAPEDLEATALADCAYRRVIRTRRIDYAGVLPRRRHMPVVVTPLGAEVERQTLMWRYFNHLSSLSTRFDPVLLAKRVLLSPPSLEQRVDFLRRKGHECEGILEQVKPLTNRSHGDSRVDALVDLLRDIWRSDIDDRVLVAAQDNLTVDYLFDLIQARLPLVGPTGEQIPLVAARIRQGMMTDAVDDLAGFGNETSENLELFQRGEAKVLFATENAQVGLNLQCARVLVLYSVPWRPEEVEQWIGRLDRIGNIAAFANDESAKSIDVYTIAQQGMVDEKVIKVLKRFHIFERGINLDGDHLEEITGLIESAALRPEQVNWSDLEEKTESMAAEDAVTELDSPLRPHLPWCEANASALKRRVYSMPPVAPVIADLSQYSATGPRSWDRAFEATINLFARSGEYDIRPVTDPTGYRFRTIWYQFGAREMYARHQSVMARVVFTFGANPYEERNPLKAHAFIMRRSDIGVPPHRAVTLSINGQKNWRPLHFMSFGDQLHDELVAGWLPKPEPQPRYLNVLLFPDHAFFNKGEPGVFLLRCSSLVPTDVFDLRELEQSAISDLSCVTVGLTSDRLAKIENQCRKWIRSALEADARWLTAEFQAELQLHCLKQSPNSWMKVSSEDLASLLNPLAHMRRGVPHGTQWFPSDTEQTAVEVALSGLGAGDEGAAKAAWSNRFPEFDRSLSVRRDLLRIEAIDSKQLRELELLDAKAKLELARNRGNRGQISRAENELAAAQAQVQITKILWDQRDAWLSACGSAIRQLPPRERLVAVLRVRKEV